MKNEKKIFNKKNMQRPVGLLYTFNILWLKR